MIINGSSNSKASWWAKHLLSAEKNERVTVKEISGLCAENIHDALYEMKAVASGTQCKNFMYQANINPVENDLTPEQWLRAIAILEKHLGLEGQPRVVVEHLKEGRVHQHIIWSRIDIDRMVAISDSLDAEKCHAASKEIAQELGLQRTYSPYDKDRDGDRPERAPRKYETMRGMETGIDPVAMKREVSQLYRDSKTGQEFIDALKEKDLQIARGDRRDYCLVDKAGDVHSLARRLEGVNVAQLREFMKDVDPQSVPTIKQVRAVLDIERPRGKGATAVHDCYSRLDSIEEFSGKLADKGLHLAQVTAADVRANSEARAAIQELQKEPGAKKTRLPAELHAGELVAVSKYGHTYAINKFTTGASKKELAEHFGKIEHGILPSVDQALIRARDPKWKQQQAGHAIDSSAARFNSRQKAKGQEHQQRAATTPYKDRRKQHQEKVKGIDRAAAGIVAGGAKVLGHVAESVATGIEQLLGGGPSHSQDAPAPLPEAEKNGAVLSAEQEAFNKAVLERIQQNAKERDKSRDRDGRGR